MKGIFVNEDGGIRYAEAIVKGYKTIETRSRNMLSACTNERVAIIRTRRNRKPTVMGYAYMVGGAYIRKEVFDTYFHQHLIPTGSKYDCTGKGKWCYFLRDAEECEPYELPTSAIRHGRSWCEF